MAENAFIEYPKYVDHPTVKVGNHPARVVVKNKEEEEKLLGKKIVNKEPPKGWSKE